MALWTSIRLNRLSLSTLTDYRNEQAQAIIWAVVGLSTFVPARLAYSTPIVKRETLTTLSPRGNSAWPELADDSGQKAD